MALALSLLWAACNQNVVNTPIRSFDGPTDVALSCVEFDPVSNLFNARPLGDCDPLKQTALQVADAKGNTFVPNLRALVPNAVRGELAEVDVVGEKLVDLNREVPGFGFLPVGQQPEHVRVSSDGCVAVTANAGSCDLSWVDLPTLYNLPFAPFVDGGVSGAGASVDAGPLVVRDDNVVRRLVPTVKGVPLGARPSWIELAPESKDGLRGFEPGGVPGACVGGQYRAWVALPACQLVVEVDLNGALSQKGIAPAEVLRAVRVTQEGSQVVTDLSTLSCPAECVDQPNIDGGVGPRTSTLDAGVVTPSDGGTRLPSSQAFPATIAVDAEQGAGRLFIGDAVGERITIVPLDFTSGEVGVPRGIALETGALGVQTVRVGPRSEAGKFLYAIARDATVRVIDLDRERECETNPDPRLFNTLPPDDPQPAARRLGCFPLGDPATPPRDSLSTSPGISLPNGVLPRDVTFVHLDVAPPSPNGAAPLAATPRVLVGDFAWLIGSDGHGFVVQIYDACPAPNAPQTVDGGVASSTTECSLGQAEVSRATALSNFGAPQPVTYSRIAHRLRNGNDRFAQPTGPTDSTGTPRLSDPLNPVQLTINGTAVASGPTLPGFVSVPASCQLGTAGCQQIAFVDVDHIQDEIWSLSWEGALPGFQKSQQLPNQQNPREQRNLGHVLPSGTLVDSGASFCSRGVLKGDSVLLVGCIDDTDCDVQQTCVTDPGAPQDLTTIHGQGAGLCLDRNAVAAETATCGFLLRGLRRYRILSAKQGVAVSTGATSDLTDQLTLGEIYEPEHPEETRLCTVDADCAGTTVSAANGTQLGTRCLRDSDGAKRCLRACDLHSTDPLATACGVDFECATTQLGDQRCLRAPLDPEALRVCMRELQSYEIHVGDAFLVSGTQTGVLIDAEANPATRECQVVPVSSEYTRLRQARIPISPAACPPLSDPLASLAPLTNLNVCQLPSSDGPVLHFENPFFNLGVVLASTSPIPPDLFTLSFTVVGGGFPLTVSLGADSSETQAQLPRAAVTAPDRQTVYIVDEGKQTLATGLRGQLLRLFSTITAIDLTFVVR